MKNLYKSVLSFLMVAAMVFGTQTASATCKSTRGMGFTYSNAKSCMTYVFEGSVSTSGCIKYSWNLYNGTTLLQSSAARVFSYTFANNGSYTARLQISDTCNKCDTVIYQTIGVKCSTSCTWYNLKPTIGYANTCRKFTFYSGDLKDTCIKYSWTVDGKAVNAYAGNSRYMIDSFTADGTYSVCVKLTNKCKNCDTTLCLSVTAKACATKCNFGAKKPYFSVWDSCKTLYGYIGPANSCYKYTWTVNGTVVSHDRMFNKYGISANGTYQICVNVKDTCLGCDTTYCGTRSITCFTTKCNFGATKQYFTVWVDSCKYIVGYYQPTSTCFKYTWTLNGNVVGHLNSYKSAISANGTYKLCLNIKDTCKGCDTTYCGSQTVTCYPTKCSWKGMEFSSSNKCRAYTFEGKNMSNGCLKYQFYIYTSGTTVTLSPGRIATYTFPATGSYYVKMNVRDTCHNCDTSIYVLYKIDCNPCGLNPDFSWKADCRKVKFVASGGITGATYYWSFGDGSSGTNGDPSHTYLKDGVYKVCLTMVWKDPNTGESCKKQVCKEIKVHCEEPCNLKGDFSFTNKSGTVKFNATSNSGYYYEWSFGDGVAGSGKDPSHTYKKPGTYTVCLKITDKARKCSITICKKVVIEDPCNLKGDFTWTSSTSATGGVKFNASSNGSYYSWDFGDGTTGTGKDPSHTYSKPGTYTVCVTIYGTNTRCKIKVCHTITIYEKCNWAKLGASFGYAVKCPYMTLEAKNLTTTKCIKYYFTVTNSAGTATKYSGRVQTISVTTGTYKVCLTLYDSCKKCDTSICREIKVECSTKCNFGANHPYFSVWDSCKTLYGYIGFNSTMASCYKYTWSVNGNVISHDRYLKNYSIYNNGTYQLCVNVKDTCHGCDTTYCGNRTITCFGTGSKCNWKAKYPNFTSFSAGAKCFNIEAGLNTSSYGCIKQYYSLAGTAAAYDGKTYHSWTVSKAGTYNICIKLVDTCTKCDTTICKDITVTNCCTGWTGAGFTVSSNANCVYNFAANSLTKSCLKYQYTLSTSSTGTGTVIGKNSKAEYAMTANGTYYICLKITDTCNNCDTSICKSVTVTCACDAHASFAIDSITSSGIMYVHSTSTGSPSAYFWDFGDSSSSTSSAPGKHAYKNSGTYTVCLTVYGTNKCTTTYCYTIKVTKTRSMASTSNVSVSVPVNIYPNPASASFTITTLGNATYQVLDLNGRVIASGNLQNSASVSSSGWRDGVYVVKVIAADGIGTTRVMIQK